MKRVLYAVTLFTLFSLPAFVPAVAQVPPAAPKHATGYKPLSPERRAAVHADRLKAVGRRMQSVVAASTPPAEFDAADMGWTVPPGDQAQCGSCYLYSTVKTMSNAAVKAGLGKNTTFKLATQFGMDCHDFGGCNGGNGTEVIDWACKNGWYAEADPNQQASALYPQYVARSSQCRVPSGAKKFTPKNWFFITSDQSDRPATVDEYKAALTTYGTVNIAIDAGGQFSGYSGGVITSMGSSIDHEVQIRGYSDSKQAVLCENQWAGWGGAKAPGDNCCWISYKALSAIQDPFVVVFDSPTPPPVAPVITSAATASGVIGTAFTFQVTATGSPTTITATPLPAGLTINPATGVITGTPSAAGQTVATVTATSPLGAGTGTLTITVTTTPVPPGPPPPPTPGQVTIGLTPEQVASVNAQSGATVITGGMTLTQLVALINAQNGSVTITKDMTLQQLLEALEKAKAGRPCCDPKPAPPPASSREPPKNDQADATRLAKDVADLKTAVDEIMKALLAGKKE